MAFDARGSGDGGGIMTAFTVSISFIQQLHHRLHHDDRSLFCSTSYTEIFALIQGRKYDSAKVVSLASPI